MKIVRNGVFKIPLYHGTSSLFIDSIREHGLGGKDPLRELGARDLYSELFEIAERALAGDPHWCDIRDKEYGPVYRQQVTNDNFNFKHGEAYLTVFLELAKKYACECACGCEYIDYILKLYLFLRVKGVAGLDEYDSRPIIKLLKKPYYQILITLHDMKVADIESETGNRLKKQLMKIERYISAGIYPPHSFKLKRPVNQKNFTIKYLCAQTRCAWQQVEEFEAVAALV